MKNKVKLTFAALLAILLWIGIVLQFYISIPDYLDKGRTLGGAIVQLLSYFTIQTNFLLALLLSLLVIKPQSKWARFFAQPHVISAMAAYITIVGLVYHFMLRTQFHPVGLFKVTSDIFHIVSPIAFIAFWLFLVNKPLIKWINILLWLVYPLIYTIYILVRGALTGYYPYNFLEVNTLGYGKVMANCGFLLVGFIILNAIFILISRLSAKQANA
ncbi:Pr6Pr family membrane protein [Mucilaginibacter calamicampi]|uniref:Pr6Pr family membrane protein n=1 Tax=Mucilaginibacter calamicampi TaxID=1302352 RepID=A0ABW2YUM9_9SPHI